MGSVWRWIRRALQRARVAVAVLVRKARGLPVGAWEFLMAAAISYAFIPLRMGCRRCGYDAMAELVGPEQWLIVPLNAHRPARGRVHYARWPHCPECRVPLEVLAGDLVPPHPH